MNTSLKIKHCACIRKSLGEIVSLLVDAGYQAELASGWGNTQTVTNATYNQVEQVFGIEHNDLNYM